MAGQVLQSITYKYSKYYSPYLSGLPGAMTGYTFTVEDPNPDCPINTVYATLPQASLMANPQIYKASNLAC